MHRHDGFYLRMGLGGGYLASRVDSPFGELSANGGGLAIELALGGTVADGLVIGGGIYSAQMSRTHWKGDGVRAATEESSVSGGQGTIGLLAVMVDYYPNPKDGFHVQGGLGIGTLSFDRDSATGLPNEDWTGGGGGAMLGVGYEAWIGPQWSIGGVARLLVMSSSLRGKDSDLTFDAKGYAPSLLFVATHH